MAVFRKLSPNFQNIIIKAGIFVTVFERFV